jgi:hypothetical protein
VSDYVTCMNCGALLPPPSSAAHQYVVRIPTSVTVAPPAFVLNPPMIDLHVTCRDIAMQLTRERDDLLAKLRALDAIETIICACGYEVPVLKPRTGAA